MSLWRKARKDKTFSILSPYPKIKNIQFRQQDFIMKSNNVISGTFNIQSKKEYDSKTIEKSIRKYLFNIDIKNTIVIVNECKVSPTTKKILTPVCITYKHNNKTSTDDVIEILNGINEIFNTNSNTNSNKLCHNKTDSNK